MPGLLDLPVEVITMICGYIPTRIATMRLVNRELNGLTEPALINHFIHTVQLVPEIQHTSMWCLEYLANQRIHFFLNNVRELNVHSYTVDAQPWNGEYDIHDEDKLSDSIARFYEGLKRCLPVMPNVRKVSCKNTMPRGSDGRTMNFFGADALRQHQQRFNYQVAPTRGRLLPHQLASELVWTVIRAIADCGWYTNVEHLDLSPETQTLQTLYAAFRYRLCHNLTCHTIKSLALDLQDTTTNNYLIYLVGRDPETVPIHFPSTQPMGFDEHACLPALDSNSRNAYEKEHLSIDRAYIQALCRHFPNLEMLDFKLFLNLDGAPAPEYDMIPSFMPVGLKELTIRCWLGDGEDFATLLATLPQLRKLTLDGVIFRDEEVFRSIMRACIRHPAISYVRCLGIRVGYYNVHTDGTDLCLGGCKGRWCKRFDYLPLDMDTSTSLFGVKDVLAQWERDCHAVEDALTIDVEDVSDALALLFAEEES